MKKNKENIFEKMRKEKLEKWGKERDIWNMYYAGLISIQEANKRVEKIKRDEER